MGLPGTGDGKGRGDNDSSDDDVTSDDDNDDDECSSSNDERKPLGETSGRLGVLHASGRVPTRWMTDQGPHANETGIGCCADRPSQLDAKVGEDVKEARRRLRVERGTGMRLGKLGR